MGKWTIKVRAGWWENNLGEYTSTRWVGFTTGIDQKLSCPWIACVWKWSMHPKWATWIGRWGLFQKSTQIFPMVFPYFPRFISDQDFHPPSAMVSARLTVQGEMIGRNFPSPEVAERSLEQYSTAVLEHTLTPPPLPKAEFRAAMQEPREKGTQWKPKRGWKKCWKISWSHLVHQNLENPKWLETEILQADVLSGAGRHFGQTLPRHGVQEWLWQWLQTCYCLHSI